MLIINPASAGSARYWERSAVSSTWLGHGAPLLGLSGPVDVADLRAVMRGLDPGGVPLTSRPGLRQRQGWDLVFAAPKSVSLLVATAPASSAEPLTSAFRGAVADAVSVLEERAAWLRSGGEQVAARGVVAASFEHTANDAGHPHLHAHLVLANIGAKADQGWGCLVSSELWRWREALGAGFQLALRSRITEAGFGFRWELTSGGLGEIVSVPSRARAVASSRSLGLRAGARSFGSASSASERAAQGKTRQAGVRGSGVGGVGGVGGGALAALGAAGWGPDQAAEVLRRARGRPALPAPPPSREAVAGALAARSSVFGEPDVLVAVAETLARRLRPAPGSGVVAPLVRAEPWGGNCAQAGTTLDDRARRRDRPEGAGHGERSAFCSPRSGQPRTGRRRARGASGTAQGSGCSTRSGLRRGRCGDVAEGAVACAGGLRRRGPGGLAGGGNDGACHLPLGAFG